MAHHRCEELIVIHQYVFTKYTYMFKEIVDTFKEVIKVAASASWSVPISVFELLTSGSPPTYFVPKGWRKDPVEHPVRSWYSPTTRPGHVGVCCISLSKLGLGFLRKMMTQSRQGRRDRIKSIFDTLAPIIHSVIGLHPPTRYRHFVHAPACGPGDVENPGVLIEALPESMPPGMEGGNSAWSIVTNECRSTHDFGNMASNRFQFESLHTWRKIGWVFWDEVRLKQFHFLWEAHGRLELSPWLEARQLYHEERVEEPGLPMEILHRSLSRPFWERFIIPMFYRTDPMGHYRQFEHPNARGRVAQLLDDAREHALEDALPVVPDRGTN